MTKCLIFILVFSFTTHSAAAGIKWNILPEESFFRFSGIQAGNVSYDGEFKAFDARLCFDERTIDKAWAEFTFDVVTATTGVRERDEILRSEEWMNAEKYPFITFKTDNITRLGPNIYEAQGTLIIKGVTHPFTIPFTLNLVSETATGTFTIDRRNFNIGDGAWGETEKWVAFPIEVNFRITATTKGEDCDGQN